ncbi:MAG TPA: hypothetical protein VKU77_31140 [Streptosporangiaceae bacterium]|nr:hypothetical protein [Streptosporangiaceae bacterium]
MNRASRAPISRPAHRPLTAPAPVARAVVSRPVTRSISRRSLPTMSSLPTGKPSSDSRSTARWAAPYSSKRATVFHAALIGFSIGVP